MVQWVNHLRNNIFINLPSLPLLCEISGALHLAQPGLTTGRLAGGQNCASEVTALNFSPTHYMPSQHLMYDLFFA